MRNLPKSVKTAPKWISVFLSISFLEKPKQAGTNSKNRRPTQMDRVTGISRKKLMDTIVEVTAAGVITVIGGRTRSKLCFSFVLMLF